MTTTLTLAPTQQQHQQQQQQQKRKMSGLVEKNYFVEVREMRRRRAEGGR